LNQWLIIRFDYCFDFLYFCLFNCIAFSGFGVLGSEGYATDIVRFYAFLNVFNLFIYLICYVNWVLSWLQFYVIIIVWFGLEFDNHGFQWNWFVSNCVLSGIIYSEKLWITVTSVGVSDNVSRTCRTFQTPLERVKLKLCLFFTWTLVRHVLDMHWEAEPSSAFGRTLLGHS
jgi:hypothetical protein